MKTLSNLIKPSLLYLLRTHKRAIANDIREHDIEDANENIFSYVRLNNKEFIFGLKGKVGEKFSLL